MQYFESKWSLLEYLGKDRKDVRLVDRLIVKREVGKNERGYYVVREAWKERVEELERENEELRRWWVVVSSDEMVAKGLYEDEQRKNGELSERVLELERKLKDMESSKWCSNDEVSDLEYQIQVNEKLEKLIVQYQEAIKQWYLIYKECNKKATWPQYKDRIGLKLDVKWEDNQ